MAVGITFQVDDVAPAKKPHATRPLALAYPDALSFGVDPQRRVLVEAGVHPLLLAVHVAFAEHRRLVLSPDHLWLTIAQGVAQHIRLNAEALRGRFVRHAGKKRLEVMLGQETPPVTAAEWVPLMAQFRVLLSAEIGEGLGRLLVCDFTTTGEPERLASEVILLDAFSPYYDYVLYCICGIPEITLLGNPDDWRKLRARLDVVRELELGWWVDDLVPLADQWIQTALGRPDRGFWQGIYKPHASYGGDVISGWIARLYPYLKEAGAYGRKNPLIGVPMDALPKSDEKHAYNGPGIQSDQPSAALGRALIRCLGAGGMALGSMAIEGGLLAVEQDGEGRLIPLAGYLISRDESSASELLESIPGEREAAASSSSELERRLEGLNAELIEIYRQLRAARLQFGSHAWRLRPLEEHQQVELATPSGLTIQARRMIDLGDGTSLCLADQGWTRLREALLVDEPSEVALVPRRVRSSESIEELPWLGPSLAALLRGAIDSNGALPPSSSTLLERVPEVYRRPPPKNTGLFDRLFRKP